MKKILTVIAAALILTGCKTSEANYRAAYETAKRQTEARHGDPDIPTQQLQQYNLPRPTAVAPGDTLPVLRERVTPVNVEGITTEGRMQAYNVVVGQFHQLFNAKAMLGRLIPGGYKDAFVVKNSQPVYYVIAQSSATPDEAGMALRAVEADSTMRLRAPLPFILCPVVYGAH